MTSQTLEPTGDLLFPSQRETLKTLFLRQGPEQFWVKRAPERAGFVTVTELTQAVEDSGIKNWKPAIR